MEMVTVQHQTAVSANQDTMVLGVSPGTVMEFTIILQELYAVLEELAQAQTAAPVPVHIMVKIV